MPHKPFDYSKWDNIEISDDEEDCHPNIDKASWFRMKHRSRVEREDQEEEEKRHLHDANRADEARAKEIDTLLAEMKSGGEASEYEDEEALKAELSEIKQRVRERNERMDYMERNRKWNVDNICHTASEKTIVSGVGSDGSELHGGLVSGPHNKPSKKMGPESEKEAVISYSTFVENHEAELEDFLQTVALSDIKDKLHKHGHIFLHEHAQSYILLSCLEDEMNGFHDKMRRAARNSQILSHITELGVSMRRHPRDVVLPFFKRIEEPVYKAGFDNAVEGFVDRIQKRAVEKRKEMQKDNTVELSREERLGPGGLDPVEVFESLPKPLQEAFESKDMQMLQVALESMPIEDAKRHMERCEASGLWVSNKNQSDAPASDDPAQSDPVDDADATDDADDEVRQRPAEPIAQAS